VDAVLRGPGFDGIREDRGPAVRIEGRKVHRGDAHRRTCCLPLQAIRIGDGGAQAPQLAGDVTIVGRLVSEGAARGQPGRLGGGPEAAAGDQVGPHLHRAIVEEPHDAREVRQQRAQPGCRVPPPEVVVPPDQDLLSRAVVNPRQITERLMRAGGPREVPHQDHQIPVAHGGIPRRSQGRGVIRPTEPVHVLRAGAGQVGVAEGEEAHGSQGGGRSWRSRALPGASTPWWGRTAGASAPVRLNVRTTPPSWTSTKSPEASVACRPTSSRSAWGYTRRSCSSGGWTRNRAPATGSPSAPRTRPRISPASRMATASGAQAASLSAPTPASSAHSHSKGTASIHTPSRSSRGRVPSWAAS